MIYSGLMVLGNFASCIITKELSLLNYLKTYI